MKTRTNAFSSQFSSGEGQISSPQGTWVQHHLGSLVSLFFGIKTTDRHLSVYVASLAKCELGTLWWWSILICMVTQWMLATVFNIIFGKTQTNIDNTKMENKQLQEVMYKRTPKTKFLLVYILFWVCFMLSLFHCEYSRNMFKPCWEISV